MRHRKDTAKLGRTSSHKRAMMANMLKSLIVNERLMTTEAKAKELRRWADWMITLAKGNDLASRRRAVAALQVSFNRLTSKEARVKENKEQFYNTDRLVIQKLFGTLGPRFSNRQGGYTRIVKYGVRVGDNAETCLLEFVE